MTKLKMMMLKTMKMSDRKILDKLQTLLMTRSLKKKHRKAT
jgi:hypothetical protein